MKICEGRRGDLSAARKMPSQLHQLVFSARLFVFLPMPVAHRSGSKHSSSSRHNHHCWQESHNTLPYLSEHMISTTKMYESKYERTFVRSCVRANICSAVSNID